jgi:ribosome maturation factor RimP
VLPEYQEHPYEADLQNALKGIGVKILDFNTRTKSGVTNVHVTLVGEKGLGVDLIAKAHKLLLPRLEILMENQDITMEVSSPGINRNFKTRKDFEVFQDKTIRLYSLKNSDWISGINRGIQGNTVLLETDKNVTEAFALSDIQKAKLES